MLTPGQAGSTTPRFVEEDIIGRRDTVPLRDNPLRERVSPATIARDLLPEPAKRLVRPLLARGRHLRVRAAAARRRASPLVANPAALETAVGTLVVDTDDALVTPELRRQGTWEPEVHRAIERALFPGATFVDVGANIGYFTILASRLVGSGGRVFAIEPDEASVGLLRANLELNECRNVTVFPVAAADRPGSGRLITSRDGRSGSAVEIGATGEGTIVRCERLDGLLAGARVDVVKVDAEGSEPLALLGARETIAAAPRLLAIVEFRPMLPQGGFSPSETLALYESLGFALHVLRANGTGRRVDARTLLELRPPSQFVTLVLAKGWPA